jgi:TPP-dependent 2-oxoacid decarboxylase
VFNLSLAFQEVGTESSTVHWANFLTKCSDYELALLDLVSGNGLSWRGNPNELVASYAADGYARVNGVAAFVSTFGPGELSAYCGVAG